MARGKSGGLALLVCLALQGVSFLSSPVLRSRVSRIPRFAEGGGGAAPDAEAEAPITPLFQELNVTASTDAKKLMGAMVAIFNNGDRAVDLVLKSPSNRSTLMYAIADLPSNFRPAAQVLLRRRDRNMRLRVLQHFRPAQDQQPEAMRISKQTNSSKLGSAIMSKFVDVAGNNLQRSVLLEFQGAQTASIALDAIEKAQHKAHREFTFMPRKVYSPQEGGSDDTPVRGGVQMNVVVVAT
ncbi:unnamed protein product [Effrenium voratum]|uniref:Uncharacterized protein n=1 Tax=Effrenium voratum TaxID=2562239 RepID=A0AA36IZE6_9DINO|nr:unnamed protein product [Effrenium voratum]